MKKMIFAVMAIALVALIVGCSKDDQQKELTMEVNGITDNTAILNCKFTPEMSSTYEIRIGGTVFKDFSEDMQLKLSNLAPGKKHTVEAIIYDVNHKQIGIVEVVFKTTGEPDNSIYKDVVLTPTYENLTSMILIEDNSENSVSVTYTYLRRMGDIGFSFSCDNGGVFNENDENELFTPTLYTSTTTLTLSNLKSGTVYTIKVKVHAEKEDNEREDVKTFTKE